MVNPEKNLPERIGPYRILRRLGHGGMAQVFLALAYGASGFEKRIALKTLLPELQGDGTLERLLIEEAKLGARLVHRNLLQVHELGVDQGTYYVRMDYVDGADLATLLKRARPSPQLALLLVEEVALALEYIHSLADDAGRPLGLVHRDVSPANILLSRAGEAKLADFGIAKATLLSDITWGRIFKGKYAYLSPEQIAGEPLSPRSDLFGLGVTLCELLCGERPYDGETPLETMEKIKEAAPPKLSAIPRKLRPLVLRCLRRKPAERFESAEALRRALAEARAAYPLVGPVELGRFVAEISARL
jgi:eukaryotic-like serine/threonine-protein kinase